MTKRATPAPNRVCAGSGNCGCRIIRLLVCVLCLAMFGDDCRAQPQTLVADHPPVDVLPVDWIFVIDTSASMSGHGPPGLNIFPRVQRTLRDFVPHVRDGDSLSVFVFGRDSRRFSTGAPRLIQGDADRAQAAASFDRLLAMGDRTHTGAALKDALTEYYSRVDKSRPAAIILFTDGVEDIRGIPHPTKIPSAIQLIRDNDLPYVFYVSLGTAADEQLRQLVSRLEKSHHGEFFGDPGATRLASVAESIRKRMRAPRPLDVNPLVLDLGGRRPGQEFAARIMVRSAANAKVGVAAEGEPADLTVRGLPSSLSISAAKQASIDLTYIIGQKMRQGPYTYKIVLSPINPPPAVSPEPLAVDVRLRVEPSLWQRATGMVHAYPLQLCLLALAIAALLIFLFRDPLVALWDEFRPGEKRAAAFLVSSNNGARVVLDRPVTSLPAPFLIRQQGGAHLIEALAAVKVVEHRDVYQLQAGQVRPLVAGAAIEPEGYPGSFVYRNPNLRRR